MVSVLANRHITVVLLLIILSKALHIFKKTVSNRFHLVHLFYILFIIFIILNLVWSTNIAT